MHVLAGYPSLLFLSGGIVSMFGASGLETPQPSAVTSPARV